MIRMDEKKTVFISYSHKDEKWKDELVTHLKVLEPEGVYQLWDDRQIQPGSDWKPQIENALNNADAAILMVSANFLTSNFILNEEVPALIKKRQEEGLLLFPFIVKPCAWTKVSWLSPIQALPKDGEPLTKGSEYQIEEKLAQFASTVFDLLKHHVRKEVKDDGVEEKEEIENEEEIEPSIDEGEKGEIADDDGVIEYTLEVTPEFEDDLNEKRSRGIDSLFGIPPSLRKKQLRQVLERIPDMQKLNEATQMLKTPENRQNTTLELTDKGKINHLFKLNESAKSSDSMKLTF